MSTAIFQLNRTNLSSFFATFLSFRNCFFHFCSWTSTFSNSRILRILKCVVNLNLKHFLWMFFFFRKWSYIFFILFSEIWMQPYFSFPFFWNLCMYMKGVAYIQDKLLFKKVAFWVCLKTRCASKQDALVLVTLQYIINS